MHGFFLFVVMFHIIPINDSEGHSLDEGCMCSPKVEVIDGGRIMVTHNSYDGREYAERANLLLGNGGVGNSDGWLMQEI